MKHTFFLGFYLMITIISNAQTVYQLQYAQPSQQSSVICDGMLVCFDDGSAILRARYTDALNKSLVLEEILLQEDYREDVADSITHGNIFYHSTGGQFLLGQGSTTKTTLIRFKLAIDSLAFEPDAIAALQTQLDTSFTQFSSVKIVDIKELKEDLVLTYFSKNDAFYKNLFKVRTRSLSMFEKQSKLILLAVANTNDSSIGASCLKDLNRTVETFTNIADVLGIKKVITTISGNTYSKENVEKELKAITPGSNDIVVFYYSGHGFRKDKDGRTFPYIDLRPKPDNSYLVNSLNMEDVFNGIKQKGARLNLVLSDCCNNSIEDNNIISAPIPAKKGGGLGWSVSNCQALFLNPKPTSLLVTAADIGQLASSNNKFGGFFSYFFKTSMENQLSFFKMDVSWKKVLEDMKRQTIYKAEHTYCPVPDDPKNICEQTPVWK